jgi:VTC domain-containing protein
MTDSLPNPRYERKFIATGRTVAEVLALVQRHPAGFRQAYPQRVVNNIYFDTPGLNDYHDHVNGAARRVKTRIRWYGSTAARVEQPMLECKLKRGLVSGKLAHGLPGFPLDQGALHPHLAAAFDRATLPGNVRAALRSRDASLFNRYRRHYFVSADTHFRLTVDYNLEFGHVCRNNGSAVSLGPRSPIVVIELKFTTTHAEHAAALTNAVPFRMARCSKYVLGLDCLGAH